MMTKYGRQNVPRIAILLTDGFADLDQDITIPEATEAKRKQIKIMVVGELRLHFYDNYEYCSILTDDLIATF